MASSDLTLNLEDLNGRTLCGAEALEVRAELSNKNSGKKKYKRGKLDIIEIKNIADSKAVKYTLETFTESRDWRRGKEPADGPLGGREDVTPRDMWTVPVTPPGMFQEHTVRVEEPGTSYVRVCRACLRRGATRCTTCLGRGRTWDNNNPLDCAPCEGFGDVRLDRCTCDGTGTERCASCRPRGWTCPLCAGTRRLRCFTEITVTWQTHEDSRVFGGTSLPDGDDTEVAFSEERPRVAPVTGFLDPQIGQASQDLVNKHATAWPQQRILMQRHSVQIVPVNSVEYILDGKEGVFFIYGDENKVHFPDYPSQCCGCCVIM